MSIIQELKKLMSESEKDVAVINLKPTSPNKIYLNFYDAFTYGDVTWTTQKYVDDIFTVEKEILPTVEDKIGIKDVDYKIVYEKDLEQVYNDKVSGDVKSYDVSFKGM